MGVKSFFARPYANVVRRRIERWNTEAIRSQEYWFHKLILEGRKTTFGKEHHFNDIATYEEYVNRVPIREYEAFIPYIDKIKEGEDDVLWKGRPIYFAKSSGTTTGVKYIPITKDSISNHIDSARNSLLLYIAETGDTRFVNGKMIFLSGSPELEKVG